MSPKSLASIKTLVVKIGTTLLTNKQGFDGRILEQLVKELAILKRERSINILIVSYFKFLLNPLRGSGFFISSYPALRTGLFILNHIRGFFLSNPERI